MFVLSNLYSGGAQRTILNIVNGLDSDKYNIKLVLLKRTQDELYINSLSENVDYEYLDRRALKASFRLRKSVIKFNPVIIFSTLGYVNFLTIFTSVLFFRKPIIILRETIFRKFVNLKDKLVFKWVHKISDFNIALSAGVEENMIINYGVKKEKIQLIYNPLDIDMINKKKLLPVSFEYTKSLKLIVVGRLAEQKNHIMILKALNYFKKNYHDDFELIILGDGVLKGFLLDSIKQFNLTENVKLLGNIENPYPYFHKADIMLMSSNYEGFGHVIIEAMITRTLVISTDCPYGPREIIKEDYGILLDIDDHVSMANKILEYTKDFTKYEKIIDKAYKRTEDFNLKKIIKEYDELFSRLIVKKKGRL